MLIIGWDYHPGFQQIVLVDTENGERTAVSITQLCLRGTQIPIRHRC